MPLIKTENWEPSPDNPDRHVYIGQRTAREVFDDLHAHLQSIGYLPDDYFLFDAHGNWTHDREFPQDAWLTCAVDYGGSEGIYLDVALEYYDGEKKCEHFATGKTLDESGYAMDRMSLIASAIKKAFNDEGVHARYVALGGAEPESEGVIVSLSTEERVAVVKGLLQQRDRLEPKHPDYEPVNRLLCRVGGANVQRTIAAQQPPGIQFSRVQLLTASGESAEFYTSGVPGEADLMAHEGFIGFKEFLAGLRDFEGESITAVVTPFSEDSGPARDAGEEDLAWVRCAVAECDVDVISDWRRGTAFQFEIEPNFDMEPELGMGGMR